ncbi:hypothetical protein VHEMI02164 [[Torrubiella] hemipterigena]|uniref:Uncharacterized protein n=1 Tax=[Torrubiella] hemipterigena TaxID=1531966 RepID=A0A0A1SNT8_9HYPO|nr:hypothetical protein VHEMI02164 [[Torrubiella] hemipterigena]
MAKLAASFDNLMHAQFDLFFALGSLVSDRRRDDYDLDYKPHPKKGLASLVAPVLKATQPVVTGMACGLRKSSQHLRHLFANTAAVNLLNKDEEELDRIMDILYLDFIETEIW